jgi:hypothetical protein
MTQSRIRNWSTTAASNSLASPYGAPEGTFKFSEVNDTIRQLMADVRAYAEDAQFVDLGHTISFASVSSFKITGSDQRSIYADGRRLKAFIGTGNVVGSVLSTTFAAGDTNVAITLDSGVLDSSLSSVAIGILTPTGGALPNGSFLFAGQSISLSALNAQRVSTSALVASSGSLSSMFLASPTITSPTITSPTISGGTASALTIASGSASLLTVATLSVGALATPLPISSGGTGTSTSAAARASLNVAGLADANVFSQNQQIQSGTNNFVVITATGSIEICAAGINAFVDFKRLSTDDFRARILNPLNTSLLQFATDSIDTDGPSVKWNVGSGLYGQGIAGGDKGAGTVNANQFYSNGSALPTGVAAAADMEVPTSATLAVPPSVQDRHPRHDKAKVGFTPATAAILRSSGVSGVVRDSAGTHTISFSTSFSDTNYGMNYSFLDASNATGIYVKMVSKAVGSCQVRANVNGVATDLTEVWLSFWGDQ